MTPTRPVVVVLGGHGFLGRHVAAALAAAGATAVAGPPSAQLDLAAAPPQQVAGWLRNLGANAVVNATGRIGGSPGDLERGNLLTTRRVVEALALLGTRWERPARLVHLGSAAEYGPTPTGEPIREDRDETPATPYGSAKLAASRYLLAATQRGDVDGVVLRVFNPLGRGQPASTLPGAVAARLTASLGDDLTVGALDGIRDFVSAHDVGRATAAAVLAPLATGRQTPRDHRLINIGTGIARPVRDVVEALRHLAGHQGHLIEDPDGGSDRSGRVDGAPADVDRAARLLGWRAADTLEDAVAEILTGAASLGGQRV